MADMLTWQEIERRYNEQWVQLIDYEWFEGEPYPAAGISVRSTSAQIRRPW